MTITVIALLSTASRPTPEASPRHAEWATEFRPSLAASRVRVLVLDYFIATWWLFTIEGVAVV
jgi:hypothetical protein